MDIILFKKKPLTFRAFNKFNCVVWNESNILYYNSLIALWLFLFGFQNAHKNAF